jgi:predicted KAP-like P-loop ATPase
MTNPDSNDYLSGDKPLSDPADDELGREVLAKNLADGLLRMSRPEGYVVAVYGVWGSGKSTLLAFVKHFLQEVPENSRPIIVDFNPWWFSGREDLTISFFNQLSVALDDGTHEAEELRKLISDLAELVSRYPHWTAKVGGLAAKWFAGQKKGVPELKKRLGDRLGKNGKRVIVLIDDIDRLIPGEILDVFRLIKAVGDLPNLIYFLAFDRQAVACAITSTTKINGDSYLEKIVQLPVELPIPDRISIRTLFARQLSGILTDKSAGLFDREYFREITLDGTDSFLATPRDVVRLTNVLKLTFPMVEGEVNPVDFIALEALRIFRPLVYDQIRSHPEQFVGSRPFEQAEDVTKFHNSWMETLEEKQDGSAAKVLRKLFPKFESAFANIVYRDEENWRTLLRACSPDKLPVYFRLALPLGDIARAELESLAAPSASPAQFGQSLLDLLHQKRPDGRSRVCQALEQLCDSSASIFPPEYIPGALEALFDVGDELIRANDSAGVWPEISNRHRVSRLTLLLLGRLGAEERFKIVKQQVSTGKALSTMVVIVSVLGAQHGKPPDQPLPEELRLLGADELSILEGLAATRIADAAQKSLRGESESGILDTPEFATLLYRWKEWGGEELANWLREFLVNDANILLLLNKLIPDDKISRTDDPISDLRERGYLNRVQDFINIDAHADRIESLNQRDDLTNEDRTRLKLVMLAKQDEHTIGGR